MTKEQKDLLSDLGEVSGTLKDWAEQQMADGVTPDAIKEMLREAMRLIDLG